MRGNSIFWSSHRRVVPVKRGFIWEHVWEPKLRPCSQNKSRLKEKQKNMSYIPAKY